MEPVTDTSQQLVACLPSRLRFPVIQGVIEGVQPGDVFVDDPREPSVALVVTRFGFTQLVGSAGDDARCEQTLAMLQDQRLRGRYLLWYDPSPGLREALQSRDDGRGRTRERIAYDLPATSLENSLVDDVGAAEHIDHGNFDDCADFALDLDSRFWRSADDFIDRALGIVVRREGRVASLCYAAGIGDGRAEMDVATLDEFRGQGLALLACRSFVRRCVDVGLAPSWDCFAGNEPSVRLADRLGFVERARYPFQTLNT